MQYSSLVIILTVALSFIAEAMPLQTFFGQEKQTVLMAKLAYSVRGGDFDLIYRKQIEGNISIYGVVIDDVGFEVSHLIKSESDLEKMKDHFTIRRDSSQIIPVVKWSLRFM